MYMVEITEDKMSGLAENVEKSLKYMGKVMQCIDELKSDSERKGHRDYDDEDDDEDERYGERGGYRRGMRGRGRYSRY